MKLFPRKLARCFTRRIPDRLFTPASNTKLFTTAAVLALIGPDYKFHTTIETNGNLDKHGRLTGDLVLVGRGDPNLSGRELPYTLHTQRNEHPIRVLEQLADELVQKGVKFVDGDIVADDSYFAFERYGEGWSQDDLVWADGAPVSALTINDNVIFVNILPADRVGERVFVSIVPFADYYRIDNKILTTPVGTGRKIFINREPGSTVLTLWGNVPLDDAGANEALAIEDPADFAASLFRHLLENRGVVVYGKQRTRHTELATLSTFSITTTARGGSDEALHSLQNQALVLAHYDSQAAGRRRSCHQQSQPKPARGNPVAVVGKRTRHGGNCRRRIGSPARVRTAPECYLISMSFTTAPDYLGRIWQLLMQWYSCCAMQRPNPGAALFATLFRWPESTDRSPTVSRISAFKARFTPRPDPWAA